MNSSLGCMEGKEQVFIGTWCLFPMCSQEGKEWGGHCMEEVPPSMRSREHLYWWLFTQFWNICWWPFTQLENEDRNNHTFIHIHTLVLHASSKLLTVLEVGRVWSITNLSSDYLQWSCINYSVKWLPNEPNIIPNGLHMKKIVHMAHF
jgi:hypothetical protein